MNPAMEGMILFYSAALYPVFERVGYDRAKALAMAADAVSNEQPLHLMCGDGKTIPLPEIGDVTAGKVMAVMAAFLVWTQRKAGNELSDSPLLRAANDGYTLWKAGLK